MNRKTAPKVKGGRVQKKNRHALTPNYWNTRQDILQIDIESPGKGYNHFLKKRDIIEFLEILPNWKEINIEFDAILLAEGVVCYFTERPIKAYQLLHILFHEIGHHHDRITTKSKNNSARGEEYAESYAGKYEKKIWNKYFELIDN